MPESSSRLHPIVQGRFIILAVFAALCAWLVPGVAQLQHDDDVLAFLPPEHADVVTFGEVADRFGMLSVGLVGLRADGADLLTHERTEAVREIGRRVAEQPGVRLVLSYPDLPDARIEAETLVVEALVPLHVKDPEAIRRRVLGNGNAVGNLISSDGTAAMLLVYMLDEGDPAARNKHLDGLRELVETHWQGESYFGGGPFFEHTAATASRQDIEGLSPIVVAVLVVVSALLLRSFTGACFNLLITGLGVGLVVGAHGRFGEAMTIVSSTTPVMMVALGGAFGMHIIAGYQRQIGSPAQRASATLRELWLPVVLSGLTTATAFFALLVMPQVPMQRFGVVAGLGVLLLLVLALVVLPAMLSLLPPSLVKSTPVRPLPLRWAQPVWALGVLALGGALLGSHLSADSDTRNVFDEHSVPAQADRFLSEHFGGSQFVQIAFEGDLSEPASLRSIRTITEQVGQLPQVADVRSLLEPVALLTEGFGGRAGIPASRERAAPVITNLADQAPMAQLMTADGMGAIIHVKLRDGSPQAVAGATEHIRAIVARENTAQLRVGPADQPEVARARKQLVRARVERLAGKAIDADAFDALLSGEGARAALLPEVIRLRARAFGTDEVIEPLEAEEYGTLDPAQLLRLRGKELEVLLRSRLPTLVANDPKGIRFAAEQLGMWIDEAKEAGRVQGMCTTLELASAPSSEPEPASPAAPALDALGFPIEPEPAEAKPPSGPCGELLAMVSELEDPLWTIPEGASANVERSIPIAFKVTGQPIIGQAFADSVTRSLQISTLVSIVALALVLLLAGQIRALIPAVWTLAVTAGVISLLGHPISIGTSMVSCIALGAGVDFAIHLAVRARSLGG